MEIGLENLFLELKAQQVDFSTMHLARAPRMLVVIILFVWFRFLWSWKK